MRHALLNIWFLSAILCFVPEHARANFSYSPWVHELIQKGGDMAVNVQIFDQVDEIATPEGTPVPDMSARYTLKRMTSDASVVLFENRVFDSSEADEVTPYMCHSWSNNVVGTADGSDAGCDDELEHCADCDKDGTPECNGFCAVAYRYTVVDHCPPADAPELYYWMFVEPEVHRIPDEGLGFTTGHFKSEEAGGVCDSEEKCSVTRVGREGGSSFVSMVSMFLPSLF